MNQKKVSLSYVCSVCGQVQNQWSGKCLSCQSWNSFEAVQQPLNSKTKISAQSLEINRADKLEPLASQNNRIKVGFLDIDRVLGGGLVRASLNLISGEPGIGKSTLLMQIATQLSLNYRVLYVSGEEALSQLQLRLQRLNLKSKNLDLASSTSLESILEAINAGSYDLVIIDSIQTISSLNLASASGSIAQTAYCSSEISQAVKQTNSAVILVGQVTKDGSIAGPKTLEHIVDVVIALEGDQNQGLKILKTTKNRYGSINEVAIYEMTAKGLTIVSNPSMYMLNDRISVDGSVVYGAVEGNRPILVEIQALLNKTNYGYPKRAVSGLDLNRLNVLVAMIERRLKLRLSDYDIFLNLVGGLKITDPATDLAVAMSIISAYKQLKTNKTDIVLFGELGLSGEVRSVAYTDRRINEALSLGYQQVIGPKLAKSSQYLNNPQYISVASLQAATELLF